MSDKKRHYERISVEDVRVAVKAARKNRPPHLILSQAAQRCSVCKYPFAADVKPSLSAAFAEHLRTAHKPGQKTGDVNPAAARIVREATEGLDKEPL